MNVANTFINCLDAGNNGFRRVFVLFHVKQVQQALMVRTSIPAEERKD
ncbi:hypothetical protein QF015_004035 [Paenarthrobacter sp. TE4293]